MLRKLFALCAIVGAAVFVLAGPAFAQDAPVPPDYAFPITWQATLAAIILSVVIPPLNALLTRPDASAAVKGLLSVALAFLGALAAYLVDVTGVPDWSHVLGLAFAAVIGAAGFRTVVDPGIEEAVARNTAGVGIGPPRR
jgi:uncharacterized membrane protein YfcA